MQAYEIRQTDKQLTIAINRRGSSTMKIYAILNAMFLYCGYWVWHDRHRLYAGEKGPQVMAVICAAAVTTFSWQIWNLMKPDVWVINRHRRYINTTVFP